MQDSFPTRTISVVVPCLNDAELLERCLASVARQSVQPDEVIVVDNGSVDSTAEIAYRAGARVIREERRGITWATAAGFDAAVGDILFRTDADVRLPDDFFARLHHAWDAAALNAPRTVVGVTGGGRFEIPGWKGDLLSSLYLGAYRRSVGSALGHQPLFGSNYSVQGQWWREVRGQLNLGDTFVHEDIQMSFAVRPEETVWLQRDLMVDMDSRALEGIEQMVTRFRRGFHSVTSAWKTQPPYQRLAERGRLGDRATRRVLQ